MNEILSILGFMLIGGAGLYAMLYSMCVLIFIFAGPREILKTRQNTLEVLCACLSWTGTCAYTYIGFLYSAAASPSLFVITGSILLGMTITIVAKWTISGGPAELVSI